MELCGRTVSEQGRSLNIGTWDSSHGNDFAPGACAGAAQLSVTGLIPNTGVFPGSSRVGVNILNPICPNVFPPGFLPFNFDIKSDSCYCITFSASPCTNEYCIVLENRGGEIGYVDPTNPLITNTLPNLGDTITYIDDGAGGNATLLENATVVSVVPSTLTFPALLQSWSANQRFALSWSSDSIELFSSFTVAQTYFC